MGDSTQYLVVKFKYHQKQYNKEKRVSTIYILIQNHLKNKEEINKLARPPPIKLNSKFNSMEVNVMNSILERFKFDLKIANLSVSTQNHYICYIKKFQEHFNKPASGLGIKEIKEFLTYL